MSLHLETYYYGGQQETTSTWFLPLIHQDFYFH